MRDYTFRGRDMFGVWHEGYISQRGENAIITPKNSRSGVGYYVDRETVGQYIGLTDVNGKKIFEGDILRYDNGIFEVGYYEPHMAFYFFGAFGRGGVNGFTKKSNRYEVVGNKWDNPELLGVAQ